jgi:paraquat-inducible protein B
MSRQKLSQALEAFVDALTEDELEPIRLDVIRIENDLKTAIGEIREKVEDIETAIAEMQKTCADESKFDILKDAIENLAVKTSEAFADGFTEQEEQYTEISEKLNGKIEILCEEFTSRISALEKKLADNEETNKYYE